jgi:very-short-patch-repair endonuclease
MRRSERVRKTSPELVESARYLRQHQTAAEERLWEAIRGQRTFPHRVRRQHAVGSFVLDFWIPAARLAIEIDGNIHDIPEVAAQDAERAALIEVFGISLVRFRNEDVLDDLDQVLNTITALVHDRVRESGTGEH